MPLGTNLMAINIPKSYLFWDSWMIDDRTFDQTHTRKTKFLSLSLYFWLPTLSLSLSVH